MKDAGGRVAHPDEWRHLTGDSDFVLTMTARSMEDYEGFTRKFFYENPDIKGFEGVVT